METVTSVDPIILPGLEPSPFPVLAVGASFREAETGVKVKYGQAQGSMTANQRARYENGQFIQDDDGTWVAIVNVPAGTYVLFTAISANRVIPTFESVMAQAEAVFSFFKVIPGYSADPLRAAYQNFNGTTMTTTGINLPFSGSLPDRATVIATTGGRPLTLSNWYDQSGNARNINIPSGAFDYRNRARVLLQVNSDRRRAEVEYRRNKAEVRSVSGSSHSRGEFSYPVNGKTSLTFFARVRWREGNWTVNWSSNTAFSNAYFAPIDGNRTKLRATNNGTVIDISNGLVAGEEADIHVTFAANSENGLRVYKNGVLVSQASTIGIASLEQASRNTCDLGFFRDATTLGSTASFKEIYVWDRALSIYEIGVHRQGVVALHADSLPALPAAPSITPYVAGGSFTPPSYEDAVNIAGMEFDTSDTHAAYGFDVQPGTALDGSDLDDFYTQGFRGVRYPVSMTHLYPVAFGELNKAFLDVIFTVAELCRARNMWFLIDIHNYQGWFDTELWYTRKLYPDADYALILDFYTKLGATFKDLPNVRIESMNEPSSSTGQTWRPDQLVTADDAFRFHLVAAKGLRAGGYTKTVTIAGHSFSGAHNFVTGGFAAVVAAWDDDTAFTANGQPLPTRDEIGDFAIVVHQYFDTFNSGGVSDPLSACNVNGHLRLIDVLDFALARNMKIWVTEIGIAGHANCDDILANIKSLLATTYSSVDMVLFFWAAGFGWDNVYPYTLNRMAAGTLPAGKSVGDLSPAADTVIPYFPTATPLFAVNSRAVFEGDSITSGSLAGPTWVQQYLTRVPEWRFSGNRAAAGQNIGAAVDLGGGSYGPNAVAAEMVSQTQIDAVKADLPDVVFFAGGTNDLKNTSRTASQLAIATKVCVDEYLEVAQHVVILDVLPRAVDVDGWTQSMEDRRVAFNAEKRTLLAAYENVTFVEFDDILLPPVYTEDNTHPTESFTDIIAERIEERTRHLIAQDPNLLDVYDTNDNLLKAGGANVAFTGTGGTLANATGVAPTGWAVRCDDPGLTVVSSIGTLNGRPAVILDIHGTSSNGDDVYLEFAQGGVFGSLNGDQKDMLFDAKLEDHPTQGALTGVKALYGQVDISAAATANRTASTTSNDFCGVDFSGPQRTRPRVYTADDATLNLELGIRSETGAAVAARVSIAAVSVLDASPPA